MKKLTSVILLSAISSFAVRYSLKKDQFISHVLWDNEHINYQWDLKQIAAILKHNGLSWESAKKLPVGYTFEVPATQPVTTAGKNNSSDDRSISSLTPIKNNGTLSTSLEIPKSSPVTELKLGVTTGVFHEELGVLNGDNKFIYSNMSQQLGIVFESDKEDSTYYSASLNLRNHVYDANSSFGINENIQKITHSLILGYTYRKYHNWKVTGFAENENRLFFNIQPDNTSEMQVGNSTNLGILAEWSPLYVASSLWGLGANISGSVLSNELNRNDEYRVYLFTELYEAGLRADLGYSFSDLEANSSSVRNRQVELNVNYFFL